VLRHIIAYHPYSRALCGGSTAAVPTAPWGVFQGRLRTASLVALWERMRRGSTTQAQGSRGNRIPNKASWRVWMPLPEHDGSTRANRTWAYCSSLGSTVVKSWLNTWIRDFSVKSRMHTNKQYTIVQHTTRVRQLLREDIVCASSSHSPSEQCVSLLVLVKGIDLWQASARMREGAALPLTYGMRVPDQSCAWSMPVGESCSPVRRTHRSRGCQVRGAAPAPECNCPYPMFAWFTLVHANDGRLQVGDSYLQNQAVARYQRMEREVGAWREDQQAIDHVVEIELLGRRRSHGLLVAIDLHLLVTLAADRGGSLSGCTSACRFERDRGVCVQWSRGPLGVVGARRELRVAIGLELLDDRLDWGVTCNETHSCISR